MPIPAGKPANHQRRCHANRRWKASASAGFLKSGNFRSETYFADKAGEVTVLRGGMGFSVVYAAPEFLAKRAATRERFAAFDASREREERA